jgi:2-oxoglutarate ferredoxin oxidoreductase subunit delta
MSNSALTQKKLPVFDSVRCKQCGICARFCPKEAIALDGHGNPSLADPEACTSCGLCEDMCPDWAVCLSLSQAGEADSGTA